MCKFYGSTVSLKLECVLLCFLLFFFKPQEKVQFPRFLLEKFSWENIHFQSVVFTLSVHWSYDS